MILAIDKRTYKPLAILIYPGSAHDTKIFDYVLD
jgi:hypothetical protein